MKKVKKPVPLTRLMEDVLTTLRANNLVFMSGAEIAKVLGVNPQSVAGPLGGLVQRKLIAPKRMCCVPFKIIWNPNDHYNGGKTMINKIHYGAMEKKEFFKAFIKLRWGCSRMFWRKSNVVY